MMELLVVSLRFMLTEQKHWNSGGNPVFFFQHAARFEDPVELHNLVHKNHHFFDCTTPSGLLCR